MEKYESSTKYFVLCIDDNDRANRVRSSIWALNPEVAVQSAFDYLCNHNVIDPEGKYTLRVRKIRVRDRINYEVPPTYQLA